MNLSVTLKATKTQLQVFSTIRWSKFHGCLKDAVQHLPSRLSPDFSISQLASPQESAIAPESTTISHTALKKLDPTACVYRLPMAHKSCTIIRETKKHYWFDQTPLQWYHINHQLFSLQKGEISQLTILPFSSSDMKTDGGYLIQIGTKYGVWFQQCR